MSTTDETIVPTPEDAEAALAQLEEAVVAGDDVPVAAVIEARERVSIAKLFRQGQDARAERKRQAQAAEAREAAKRAVTALMVDEDTKTTVDEAQAALEAALRGVLTAVQQHNERLEQAARIYTQADVATFQDEDRSRVDTAFFASISHGTLTSLRENGTDHSPARAGNAIHEVLWDFVTKNKPDLRNGKGTSLADKIEREF